MENRYLNKYRNRTNRLPRFDYGSSNTYSITLIVQNRKKAFGQIVNEKMDLSEIGKIAHQEWLKTYEIRKSMNLRQGEFVVMPDHFHAVISIGTNEHNRKLFYPIKWGSNHKQSAQSLEDSKPQ
jgi:putative transposase